MKQRTIVWQSAIYPGLEYLNLVEDDDGVHAQSVVIGVTTEGAFRLDYHIECDRAYRTRRLDMKLAEGVELKLRSNGKGQWFNRDSKLIPELNGCRDLDIVATPFTNTLPIRRIDWLAGQTETLTMVYITIPYLALRLEQQRYTCIEKSDQGGLFRYEGLSSGFTALLPVDADGLVLDYPGVWKRIWSA